MSNTKNYDRPSLRLRCSYWPCEGKGVYNQKTKRRTGLRSRCPCGNTFYCNKICKQRNQASHRYFCKKLMNNMRVLYCDASSYPGPCNDILKETWTEFQNYRGKNKYLLYEVFLGMAEHLIRSEDRKKYAYNWSSEILLAKLQLRRFEEAYDWIKFWMTKEKGYLSGKAPEDVSDEDEEEYILPYESSMTFGSEASEEVGSWVQHPKQNWFENPVEFMTNRWSMLKIPSGLMLGLFAVKINCIFQVRRKIQEGLNDFEVFEDQLHKFPEGSVQKRLANCFVAKSVIKQFCVSPYKEVLPKQKDIVIKMFETLGKNHIELLFRKIIRNELGQEFFHGNHWEDWRKCTNTPEINSQEWNDLQKPYSDASLKTSDMLIWKYFTEDDNVLAWIKDKLHLKVSNKIDDKWSFHDKYQDAVETDEESDNEPDPKKAKMNDEAYQPESDDSIDYFNEYHNESEYGSSDDESW